MNFRFSIFDFRLGKAPALRRAPAFQSQIANRKSQMHSAFSFTEVMFAIIILGIGFIMVAAVFPVALQQSKIATDETTAATIARAMSGALNRAFVDGAQPLSDGATNTSNCNPAPVQTTDSPGIVQQPGSNTNDVAPATATLWNAISGDLISQDDSRFGSVVLFRRDGIVGTPATWSKFIQVYVFPVQTLNSPEFGEKDRKLPPGTGSFSANLQARAVHVAIANDVPEFGGIDIIAFDTNVAAADTNALEPPKETLNANVDAAIEGAYVVISHDNIQSPTASIGRMNGRIFKLGVRRADLDGSPSMAALFPLMTSRRIYELQPGNDFTRDPGPDGIYNNSDDILAIGISGYGGTTTNYVKPAGAFLIGRSYSSEQLDSLERTGGFLGGNAPLFAGNAMPINAYVTLVAVK